MLEAAIGAQDERMGLGDGATSAGLVVCVCKGCGSFGCSCFDCDACTCTEEAVSGIEKGTAAPEVSTWIVSPGIAVCGGVTII